MKHPKIFHCRTSKTGPTTPVVVRFSEYANNHTLAVKLICAKAPWSTFAVITVNLLPVFEDDVDPEKTCAFLDTNNCPWAEEFLLDNGIATPTGVTQPSGFCVYPLYKFNKEVCYDGE